jgi:hypothetical protein
LRALVPNQEIGLKILEMEIEIDVNGLEWNLLVLIRERKREIC